MKKASIVINTYNRRAFLERTLNALQYQRYPHYEVICVNGPSTDGTETLLRQWEGRVKLASCPEANLSMSRNIGIKESCGDIVCFIDDDAVPEPGWLSALVAAYDDPAVGAAGGYIRDHTGVTYQARYQVCDRFADCFSFDSPSAAVIDGKSPQEWGTDYYTALTGTNCSFRRDLLVEIGGYDEAFAYFLDETDVLLRACEAGYTIRCIEGAEVHHKYAPSSLRTEEKIAKTLYYPIRSKVYYAFRHALPVVGLAATVERLDAYINHVSAAQSWLASTGKISQEHCTALQQDIARGQKDGAALAFSATAPYTKDASFFSAPSPFQPFPHARRERKTQKICFISQDFTPHPHGGIGVWVSTLARQMAARGHEVTVITRARDEHPTVDFEDGVWVHRIAQRHMPERPYAAPETLPQIIYDWSASAYAEVLQVALGRGIDGICAPIWDVEGIVAHCAGSIPVFLSLHTSYGLALPSKPLWNIEPGYLEKHVQPIIDAEKRLLREAPLVIANSRAIVNDMSACYNVELPMERVRLVPHGMPDKKDKDAEPTPANAQSPTVKVLFVGRFEERKGIDVLLSVIPELLAQHEELQLCLAGDHTISNFWQDFRSAHASADWLNRVHCPGFVSQQELVALYRECTIFVAPSRYESFGLIYLEAMRFGKPCIGTTAGGIPEVVIHEDNGLLIPPGNAEALSAALSSLLQNPDQREIMGKRSRELFLERFTDIKMAEEMEKVFESFFCDKQSERAMHLP